MKNFWNKLFKTEPKPKSVLGHIPIVFELEVNPADGWTHTGSDFQPGSVKIKDVLMNGVSVKTQGEK